ncbi:conserved Plasmodium protein, unknown function [Plasmodium sp. gorilla clade G3]|nr:conserved Plasmodium protein, unknown function [Plasmodium sp. gorilla clade G3]
MFLFLTNHWKEKKHKNFFFKSITTIEGKLNVDRKKKKLSSKTTKYINYLFLKRKKAEQKIHLNNIKRKLLKNISSSLSSPFEPFHVICNFKNDKLKALKKYNIEEKINNAHNLLKNISQENVSNVEYLKCIASTQIDEKNHLIETNSPKEENGTFIQMGNVNFVNYDRNYMNGQQVNLTNSQTNHMNGQQVNLTNSQTNHMNGQVNLTNSQTNHMNGQVNLTNSQTNHINRQDNITNSQTNHINRQDNPTNSTILVGDNPSRFPSYNEADSDRYLEENKFLPTVCIKKDKELKDMKSWNNINNILDLRKNKELCNIYLITSMINIYHENNYNYIILKILKEMKHIHCMSMKHISLIIYNMYKYYYIQYIKNIFYRSDEINRTNFFNSYYMFPEDDILYNNEFKIKDVLLDIEIIKKFLLSISCIIKTYIYNESDMNVLSKILFVYCFFEINNKKMNELLIDKILKSIHIKTNKRIKYFSLISLSFEKLKIYYSKIHLLHSNLLIKKMNKLIKEHNKLIISNKWKKKKKLERINLFPVHKKHKTFSLIDMKDIITYLYIIKKNNIKNNEFIKTLLKYCNIFMFKINWEDKNNSYTYSYYHKVNKKSYRTLDLFCNEENIIPLCYQNDMLRNIKLYKSFENEMEKKRKKNLLNSYKDIIILKRRRRRKKKIKNNKISHNDVNKYLALYSLYNKNKTALNDGIRENDYRNNVLVQVQNIRRETKFREKLLFIGRRGKEMMGKHNYVEGENNIKDIEKINDGVMNYQIEDNRINREVISSKNETLNIYKKGTYSSYDYNNIHLNNKNKLYYIENDHITNKYEINLICMSIFLKYLISYDYIILKNILEFNKLIEMYMNLIRNTNMKNIHFLYMYKIIEINRHIQLYNNFLTKLIYSSIFYNCKNGLFSFLSVLKRVAEMNTLRKTNKKIKGTLIKRDDSIEDSNLCYDHNYDMYDKYDKYDHYDKPYDISHVLDDDVLCKLVSSRYMWLYSLINLYKQLLKSKTHDYTLNDMLINNLIVLIDCDLNHLSYTSIYGCLKLLYMIENGMNENVKKKNKDTYIINFKKEEEEEEEEEYYNSLHNKCNKLLFIVLKKMEYIEFDNIDDILLLLKIYKYFNKIKIYRKRFEIGSYGMLLKMDDVLKKRIIIETKNIYNINIKNFIKLYIYSNNKLRNELFHMTNLNGHFLLLTKIVNKTNNDMYFFALYKCIYIHLYNYINKDIKKLNDKKLFINKDYIISSIKMLQFLRNYMMKNMSRIQNKYIYKIIMYNFFYINECIKLTNMLWSCKGNKTDFIYNNKIIRNENNNYYYIENRKKKKKKEKKKFIIYMLVKHVDIMFDIINMLLKKEKSLFFKTFNEKNVLIYIFSLYMENINRRKKKIIGYLFFSSNKNRTHGKEFLHILLKNKLHFYNNKMSTCVDIRHITYMNVLILFLLFKYEIFLRNHNMYKRYHRKNITCYLNMDVPYFEEVHNVFKYKENKNIFYHMLYTHNNDVIFIKVLFYAITKNYYILNDMNKKNIENIYINKIKRKEYNIRNDTDTLLQNYRDEGNENKWMHYENDLFELIIKNFNMLSEHFNDNKYLKSIMYNFMVHKNSISQVMKKILDKNKSEKYVI